VMLMLLCVFACACAHVYARSYHRPRLEVDPLMQFAHVCVCVCVC